jgi:hypothetical protein
VRKRTNDSAPRIRLPRVPADLVWGRNLTRVTWRSPLPLRRAVWECARHFCRELRYDFPQYGYRGRDSDRDHVAYLWTDPGWIPAHVVGAACFRLRERGYALQWAWLHPFFRRRGLLTAAWPAFRTEFGDFAVERPLSEAMQAFLRKIAGTAQRTEV